MQRDLYISATQFMEDPSFREWVLTGRDTAGWTQWTKTSPENLHLAQEAKLFLLAVGKPAPAVGRSGTSQALSESWSRIRSMEADRKAKTAYLSPWWKVAAAVLLIGVVTTWYNTKETIPAKEVAVSRPAPEQIRKYNDTPATLLVNLEDGSSVLLQPGGTLTYSETFDPEERTVHLSGEAFFEISKDPARPFLVYTNDIVTRVVGTSFRIKAFENQPQVEVFVKTGQVNVRNIKPHSNSSQQEVALLPNESVSFLKDQSLFRKASVNNKAEKGIDHLSFEFTDTPVKTIFSMIETAYGINIEYPEQVLRECYLSTSLSDEPLLGKLKIICESLGANTRYEMLGNRIIIKSNGCN